MQCGKLYHDAGVDFFPYIKSHRVDHMQVCGFTVMQFLYSDFVYSLDIKRFLCSNHSIYIIILFIFEPILSLCDFILCLLYISFSNQSPELTPMELLCYTSTDFCAHHLHVAVLILLLAGCGCLIGISDSVT